MTARFPAILVSAWVVLYSAQPTVHGAPTPEIRITPGGAFFGDRVKIALDGLEKNQLVTVSALSTNWGGQIWESHAEFLTDRHGCVDLKRQVPISGTYRHADAMGLFWSMSRMPGNRLTPHSNHSASTNGEMICITAAVRGQTVATATFQQSWLAPGVERIPVHDNGLRGALYLPSGKKPHHGVIVLGGSEGGLSPIFAASYLASKGYAALALAYFDYEDLPKSLENIRLEYFETAINWIEERKDIRHDGVAVLGGSRGGELALLLGSTFPHIRAVVAFAPSNVLWPDPGGNKQPAWTFKGQPLPFMNGPLSAEQRKEMDQLNWTNPLAMTQWCQILLEDKAAVAHSAIPVEKINGPVLLVSGNDDQLWPSTEMSDMVMERLKKTKHPFNDGHLAYPNVGHYIPPPNMPATVHAGLGGETDSTAAAAVDSWVRVINFLNSAFERQR